MKNDFLRDYFNDCKEVTLPVVKNEEADGAVDETADKVMNIVRAMTREIHERINYVARYVGIPCRVSDINEQETPATISGKKAAHKGYVGYTVDLKPFRDKFSTIRFCADAPATDDTDVVRGIIIDDNGNVECFTPSGNKPNHEWTRLPLSSKSSLLVASLPVDESGAPVFVPEYVEFLPDGIVQSLSEYMSEMIKFSNEISNRVDKPEHKECSVCCHITA